MSTQIDPLTGLPMVFDSIIEQIPLDAQIFPYADLGATARPTAPPLYPDSIIPVSAFLSGQHPDTGSAQTVETDGQHNLNVNVKAGGGGGSTLWEDATDLTQNDIQESSFGVDILWDLAYVDYADLFFMSLEASAIVDYQSTPPASGHTQFDFYYAFGGFTVWLLHGAIMYGIPATGLGNTSWHGTYSPPAPISARNSVEAPGNDMKLVYVSDGTVDLRVSSTFKFVRAHV